MTEFLINDRLFLPKRVTLNKSEWLLEGEEKNKKSIIKICDIHNFNGFFIDEIVIVRPLTNKIHVNKETNDVLKIYVDQKDTIVNMQHENRQIAEGRPTISLADIGDYDVINDAFVKTKRKKR